MSNDNNLKALSVSMSMMKATVENHKVKEVLDKMVTANTEDERRLLWSEGIVHLMELMKIDSELLKTLTD